MVSLVGSWMQMTAQSWLVLTLTDSPFKLGLVGAAQFAPSLLFTLYAGVLADRLPKRRILVLTQSVMAVCALALAFLTLSGRVEFWQVAVLALVVGTVRAFDTPARQAFFIEMTSRDDLLNAIALNSAAFNLARVAGPALAGLVIRVLGTGWAFAANGVSFLAVILALLHMDILDRGRARERSALEEIRTGLSYVRTTPPVLGIIVLLGVVSTFALNWSILVPLLARNALGLEATGYGLLMSAMGVGALAGSVALATFGGRGPQVGVLVAGAVALGLGQMVLALVRTPLGAAITLLLCGAAMVTYLSSSNTTVQSTVPDHLRGRVMSLYFLVFGGVTPFGALIVGSLAEHVGASGTFMVTGTVTALFALVMLASRRLPAPSPYDELVGPDSDSFATGTGAPSGPAAG